MLSMLAVIRLSAQEAEPGVVLVKFRASAAAADIERVEREHGLTLREQIKIFRIRIYTYEGDEAPLAKSVKVAVDPAIEVAEPNWVRELKAADPEYSNQWYLKNTGQSVAGYTGPSGVDIRWEGARSRFVERGIVRVAVVDSGVALTHKDIAGSIHTKVAETIGGYANSVDNDDNDLVDDVWGYDWFDLDSLPLDQNGHGTQVAGVIGATIGNGEGGSGISNSVEIRAYRVFNQFGRGGAPKARVGSSYITDVLFSVATAIGDNCKIVNLSLGGKAYSALEAQAYRDLVGRGVLAIVAAGNDGTDNDGTTPSYPASYDSAAIISVAAQDRTGGLAAFSNWGRTSVDIAAPGTQIRAPDVNRVTVASYDFAQGMSGWAPFRYPSSDGSYNAWTAAGGFLWDRDISGRPFYSPLTDNFAQSPVIQAGLHAGLRLEVVGAFDLADDALLLDLTSDDVDWFTYWQFSGVDSGAIQVDISDYDYSSFRIRFRLLSDYSIEGWGVAIKSLQVTAVDDLDLDNPQYTYTQGTSFSAPIVAGVAAMLWSHRPELTASQVRDILLSTARSMPTLSGKVATGGMVDADAALAKADLVTGNIAPQIVSQPTGGTFQPGGSVTLSAGTTPGLPVSYQWRLNGVGIAGATQSSFVLSGLSAAQAGTYDVVVTSKAGSVTSSAASVIISSPLAIQAAPASRLLRVGEALVLEVSATASSPLTYQWFKNNKPLVGATQAKLDLGAAVLTSAGSYIVKVFAGNQSVSSPVARVEVAALSLDLPSSRFMLPTGKLTLSVKVSGIKPVFVWRKDGVVIPGAIRASLPVPPGTAGTSATYEASLLTALGEIRTSACVVTTVIPSSASISVPPLLLGGQPLALSAEIVGTGPLALQWLKNGKPIPGATGASLEIPSAAALDSGSYSLRVVGPANKWTSPVSRLAVVDVLINKLPASVVNLSPGKSAKLTASVVGFKGAPLVWSLDGVPLPGQTKASLVVSTPGTYRVTIISPAGEKSAVVTVAPVPFAGTVAPPVFQSQPADVDVVAGSPFSLSPSVLGSGALQYQWFRNGQSIQGATSRVYSVTSASASNTGTYRLYVSNAGGQVASREVSVSLMSPPVITAQPASVAVKGPYNQTATVANYNFNSGSQGWLVGSGSTNLSPYSWVWVGGYITDRASGSTYASYTDTFAVSPWISLAGVSNSILSFYIEHYLYSDGLDYVKAEWSTDYISWSPLRTFTGTNSGTFNINMASWDGVGLYLRFRLNTSPLYNSSGVYVDNVQVAGNVLVAGEPVTISVTTPTPSVSYQWYKDGVAIPGATSNTIGATAVGYGDAGSYTVKLTNTAGSTISNAAVVTVY
jgi:hypothetical protein